MNLTAELKGSLDVVCANIRHERGGQVVHDKKANRRRLGTRQTDNSPEKVRNFWHVVATCIAEAPGGHASGV